MSTKGDGFMSDFGKLTNALMNSLNQQIDMVKAKKLKIAAELKLIPESELVKRYNYLVKEKQKNLEERSDNEIQEKLGEANPVFYIDRYYKEVDEYYTELIALYKKRLPAQNEESKLPDSDINMSLQLSDLFESSSRYAFIMKLLVHQGYCQKDTFIWKDQAKGNKGFLAAILKYLHTQQYYLNNKRPTTEQIQEIAQNTFGWDMSIDTIKKANPEKVNLDFIPPASRIN